MEAGTLCFDAFEVIHACIQRCAETERPSRPPLQECTVVNKGREDEWSLLLAMGQHDSLFVVCCATARHLTVYNGSFVAAASEPEL